MLSGTAVYYFYFCKRRLWLKLNHIGFEHTSELVHLGKLIEQQTFCRRSKKYQQLHIGNICLDMVDIQQKIVYETKKSTKFIDVAIWQVKHYLYQLSDGWKAVLQVPKERKKFNIELTDCDRIELDLTYKEIINIKSICCPDVLNQLSKCKKCSYYNFCYI